MPRTLRLLPPPEIAYRSLTVNGRSYSAAPGAVLDVPDFDAEILLANGWIAGTPICTCGQAHGGIGATAARPSPPARGMHFYDTTVGADIVFDGNTWRNAVTAAAV